MTQLGAYHGSQAEKDALVEQLQRHYDLDEIVKGQYWENGRGCAVGCTMHYASHDYASAFGFADGKSASRGWRTHYLKPYRSRRPRRFHCDLPVRLR